MANKFYEENDISAIASAIRTKLGVQTTYKVSEMASAVASIPTGITPSGKITFRENVTDADVSQYATADVIVPLFPAQLMVGTVFVPEQNADSVTIACDDANTVNYLMIYSLNMYNPTNNEMFITVLSRNPLTRDFDVSYTASSNYNSSSYSVSTQAAYTASATFNGDDTITITMIGAKRMIANKSYLVVAMYDPIVSRAKGGISNSDNGIFVSLHYVKDEEGKEAER